MKFVVTGCAAHLRLCPLLPPAWIDESPYAGRNSNNKESGDGGGGSSVPSSSSSLCDAAADEQLLAVVSAPVAAVPEFLWENAPRCETKSFRDKVKCYSHLPNGTCILDSKWVLALLFKQEEIRKHEKRATNNHHPHHLATLETHCFRGRTGFIDFRQRFFKSDNNNNDNNNMELNEPTTKSNKVECRGGPQLLPDLLENDGACPTQLAAAPKNLWVVKDASANGAGGIWVVGSDNAKSFEIPQQQQKEQDAARRSLPASPLAEQHRYVAQRYAWPPVLYGKRKCHVRVYALLTSDGRAFVHKRAFLHVANDIYNYDASRREQKQHNDKDENGNGVADKRQEQNDHESCYQDSVHITNCCANSHDKSKFSGEILADLEALTDAALPASSDEDAENSVVVALGRFFPSITASIAALAQKAYPYLQGGEANNGFEYLGIDFILSYDQNRHPVAYLLEVNAPPSQDTATGLQHAEDLHDAVISDIVHLWVLPKVTGKKEVLGGWRCAYEEDREVQDAKTSKKLILEPSKAAIINKIRWALFERRICKKIESQIREEMEARAREDDTTSGDLHSEHSKSVSQQTQQQEKILDVLTTYARSQFPYYNNFVQVSSSPQQQQQQQEIFFENAGGSQVPVQVIDMMCSSLRYRHRALVGTRSRTRAREVLGTILGAHPLDHAVFLGANASSLLHHLATQYARCGLLTTADEIIISTENHLANITPWLTAAQNTGATVKWWSPTKRQDRTKDDTTTLFTAPADEEDEDPSGAAYRTRDFASLLSARTRVVALPHASNILGQIRDMRRLCDVIEQRTGGYADVVVDGVAAAPHWFPNVATTKVDWYVVSCHKLFGPHIGGLCGSKRVVQKLQHAAAAAAKGTATTTTTNTRHADSVYPLSNKKNNNNEEEDAYKILEIGTINYEGCAGVQGIGQYLANLALCPIVDDEDQVEQQKKTNAFLESNVLLSQQQETCYFQDINNKNNKNNNNNQQRPYRQHTSDQDEEKQQQQQQQQQQQRSIGPTVTPDRMREAYRRIRMMEIPLVAALLAGLQSSSCVRIVEADDAAPGTTGGNHHHHHHTRRDTRSPNESATTDTIIARIPVVTFYHTKIASSTIVTRCRQEGILCRHGYFLCHPFLQEDMGSLPTTNKQGGTTAVEREGFVRISLAHYNTPSEIRTCLHVLASIPQW